MASWSVGGSARLGAEDLSTRSGHSYHPSPSSSSSSSPHLSLLPMAASRRFLTIVFWAHYHVSEFARLSFGGSYHDRRASFCISYILILFNISPVLCSQKVSSGCCQRWVLTTRSLTRMQFYMSVNMDRNSAHKCLAVFRAPSLQLIAKGASAYKAQLPSATILERQRTSS